MEGWKWERSPNRLYSYYFVTVNTSGSPYSYYWASHRIGVALGFCTRKSK